MNLGPLVRLVGSERFEAINALVLCHCTFSVYGLGL
jgi:hypothetical protein